MLRPTDGTLAVGEAAATRVPGCCDFDPFWPRAASEARFAYCVLTGFRGDAKSRGVATPFRFLLLAGVVALAALMIGAQPAQQPVLVYAIAWDKRCGTDHMHSWSRKWVTMENYDKERQAITAEVQRQYPGMRVNGHSSKFEYGNDVGALAYARWPHKVGNCTATKFMVKFGRNENDARNSLQQSLPRGADAKIEVLYVPRVQSAR